MWMIGSGSTWLLSLLDWMLTPKGDRRRAWAMDTRMRRGMSRGLAWVSGTVVWLVVWPLATVLMVGCWVVGRRTLGSTGIDVMDKMVGAMSRKAALHEEWLEQCRLHDALTLRMGALLDELDVMEEGMGPESLDEVEEGLAVSRELLKGAEDISMRMNRIDAKIRDVGMLGREKV